MNTTDPAEIRAALRLPECLPDPWVIAQGSHGPGRCEYRLHGLWQLHLYPYSCAAEIDGHRLTIRPGTAGLTPPGMAMRYELGQTGTHLYAHFACANRLADSPCLVDLGADYRRVERHLTEAVPWVATDPRRAAVRLWDILGCVAAAAPGAPEAGLVVRARSWIEARLGETIELAALAAELGCSREHLARRFRAELDCTVVAYVRQRRAARAEHLLTSSTRPLSEIARSIGVADAHAFNKLIRRELGRSPRECRSRGGR